MTTQEWDVLAYLPFAREWLADQCHRHRLSPTQRRVAQFFSETMPEAAFLSTMEVAAQAGVSQPTVTRFAATLGYANYADFRHAVREVLRLGPGEEVPAAHDPVTEEQANLTALRSTLEGVELDAAAAAIARADAVTVVGLRASAALARYAGYFLDAILGEVAVHTGGAEDVVDDAAVDALAAAEDPVMVVIAMPRYPAETVRVLRRAAAAGITTILVVDSRDPDFIGDATHLLIAPVSRETVFDSHAAPVVLLMSLVDRIADRQPRRTQERLEAREETVATWEYAPGN